MANQPVEALLIGSDTCTALGITATGNAPVLKLCRALIEAGQDPARPLHAYRGATLCLIVRSIGEAAGLSVREDTSNGAPRFVAYRPYPAERHRGWCGGSPPIAAKDCPATPAAGRPK